MDSGASGVARLERVCRREAPDAPERVTIKGATPELNHRTACRGSRGSASLTNFLETCRNQQVKLSQGCCFWLDKNRWYHRRNNRTESLGCRHRDALPRD